jgi:acyl CoA:acetate/3-ketoacid CoA transferase beta subunit
MERIPLGWGGDDEATEAVFDVTANGLLLVETAPGVDEGEVRAKTGCPVLARG